jgi:hypothetical protein
MRTAVLLSLIISLVGCVPQKTTHTVDGIEYGTTSGLFRDRWWNYYERGVSFSEGGFYQEAISDFEIAIRKRKNDQWRGRTYGMHFLNYFPHRELGKVYYQLKMYGEAIEELEASLNTAESAKAKYYLNKARKGLLEETKLDKSPPTLRISSPIEGEITNSFSVKLTGEVEDDFFVSSISINAFPLLLELSAKKVLLEEELALKRGINEIKVRASDLIGKNTESTIIITVDREGPLITIEDQKSLGRKIIISGFITDSTGINTFTINGRREPLAQGSDANQSLQRNGQEVNFQQEIELPEGTDNIILKAEDIAGNVTTANLFANDVPQDSIVQKSVTNSRASPLLTYYLSNSAVIVPSQYVLQEDLLDKNPLNILIKDLSESQTVYYDTLFLEGEVRGNYKIRSLTINEEPILKREGKKIFFNHLIKLKDGVNRFSITAVDIFGNETHRVINVTRKIQKIRQIGSRMSISLLPIKSEGEQSVLGAVVNDTLTAAFVNQGRFRMIERERMEEVLRELELGQTELVDAETASKIGKIVVADAILTGTIYETAHSVEVLTRLVNTETSTIMAAKDVFDEDKSMSGLKAIMEGLALKYKNSFPLLEGLIIKKEGEVILIDLGNNKNIKPDMGLILFREGEEIKHPVSGAFLGSESIELGVAKVDNVYDEFARAIITDKEKAIKIETLDRVITK